MPDRADRERPKPGLPSIYEGREQRLRGKFSHASGKFWLACSAGLLAMIGGYYVLSQRSLESERQALLAKERAVDATVGAQWKPLRDKLESITTQTAAPTWMGDFVDTDASKWDFRSLPGVYLRLPLSEAQTPEAIRKNAQDALRDAFVGCFLREANAPLAKGVADAGPFAEQPWNLRQAYASTRILTDPWIAEVKAAGDDLRLRVFEQQYEQAANHDIPLVIDLVKRAQFFLLVIDEDTPEVAAAARERSREDAGAAPADPRVPTELLQLVPHDARVRIVNLKTGGDIARVRRRAEGGFRQVGEHAVIDPDVIDAQQRQVNSCSLAMQVQSAIGFK